MGFDSDTGLVPAGPGAFDVSVVPHWQIGGGVANGGYVAAMVTRAAQAVVGDPLRGPRSLTVHYIAACMPGPARIAVAVEREGRSLTTVSIRVTQGDATIAVGLAAFGVVRPGLDYQHLPMPEAPPAEAVAAWDAGGMGPTFPSNWEYRMCVGAAPYTRSPEALSGGWIRLREERILDAPLLAAMADAWLPPVLLLLDRPRGMVPTVDLTVHFRSAVPLEDATPGDFSFAVFSSRTGAEGYWESDGVIWSRGGRVLAQARQLAVFDARMGGGRSDPAPTASS